MTEPNRKLLEDKTLPRVKLDGVEWPIPKLSYLEVSQIVPIMTSYREWRGEGSAITAKFFENTSHVVFLGLRRGHPALTREEFDAMGTDLGELTDAYGVVCRQAGAKPAPTEVNGVTVAPLAAAALPTSSA